MLLDYKHIEMMHIYNIMFNYIAGFKNKKMTETRGILKIRLLKSGLRIPATKKKTAPD